MKLSVKAFMLTFGIFWALVVFLPGLGGLLWKGYGSVWSQAFASVYPGYQASGSFGDLIVGTLYALVDGAVSGLVFVSIYNFLAGKDTTA